MFTVNGIDYTVSIAGFEVNGVLETQFLTEEGMLNPANLVADVIASTPPCTVCPEPASLVLLGTGLVGVGLLRRRRTAG